MDLTRQLNGVALSGGACGAAALSLRMQHGADESCIGPSLPVLDQPIEKAMAKARLSPEPPLPAEAREAAETLFRLTVAHADAVPREAGA